MTDEGVDGGMVIQGSGDVCKAIPLFPVMPTEVGIQVTAPRWCVRDLGTRVRLTIAPQLRRVVDSRLRGNDGVGGGGQ